MAGEDIPQLITAWAGAMADVRAVVEELGEQGWRQPSLLPGWSVGDVVAHLDWIERILLDRHDPAHVPDWSALPHVASDFGRATEVPVDLRRSWSRGAVLEEFDATIADRLGALRGGPVDPQSPARDPFGRTTTLEAVLRMRTYDTWVHSQDIRLAVGRPGGTDTVAALVAAEQMAGGLGFVWAKRVDAPIGSTLAVEVPGIGLSRAVLRGPDGRGVTVERPRTPTVELRMDVDDFVQLMNGRTRPDRTLAEARARVEVRGDEDLAGRTLAELDIAI